jgi:hypothetical protein
VQWDQEEQRKPVRMKCAFGHLSLGNSHAVDVGNHEVDRAHRGGVWKPPALRAIGDPDRRYEQRDAAHRQPHGGDSGETTTATPIVVVRKRVRSFSVSS